MRSIMKEIAPFATQGSSHDEFRLLANPFFFKFCSANQPDRNPGSLMSGTYLPLGLWEVLEASGALLGPRGGVSIRFDNAPRWLTNTLFAELVGGAGIGTAGAASAHIAGLIRSSLQQRKSVIASVEHPKDASRPDVVNSTAFFANEVTNDRDPF